MPGGFAVVAHGGAGHDEQDADGCARAAAIAWRTLLAGRDPLAACVEAVSDLEDDPRFNAGTGAELALDGETIELDAGLMDTQGRCAAVIGLRDTAHPIQVARLIAETPMKIMFGPGATAFARAAGFPAHDCRTDLARRRWRETVQALAAGEGGDFPRAWHGFDLASYWNFPGRWEDVLKRVGKGTVGCVARDGLGRFAVATSSGGSQPMLQGRLGNTPVVGCGFYAGPAGAIAVSGVGEWAIATTLARTAYEWVAAGQPLQAALDRAIALIPPDVDMGLVGVTATEAGHAANCPFPRHMIREP